MPDITGQEGYNPTRRYKWFRPRQAMIGTAQAQAANNGVCELYNQSSAYYLVVRDLWWFTTYGTIYVGFNAGIYSDQTGTAHFGRILPGEPAGAGVLYAGYNPQLLPNPLMVTHYNQGLWTYHDLPMFVVTPGQSLVVQAGAPATMEFDRIMWEFITPDEFDYMY